jgi:hypothetical protein
MRREIRWALSAAVSLGLGAGLAGPYARFIAPFDAAVARLAATGHPWEVTSVEVAPGRSQLTAELQLHALVRPVPVDGRVGHVTGRVQVGEVVESAVVFWTLLVLWPAATSRERWIRMAVGIPIFLGLESATTATQLILPMAQASAILAGDEDPITIWDRWSRFLQAGGDFVVAVFAVLLTVSLAAAVRRFAGGGNH